MKKIITIMFTTLCLLFPININAYSDYLILGGDSIGIEINSDGILVVGFYKVNGQYNKGLPEIKVGDRIIKINETKVDTIKELLNTIKKEMNNNIVKITYIRNGREMQSDFELIYESGNYKTGLYVKDSITGIGTITYIDPATNTYGALGHEIIESNSNTLVPVKNGKIFKSIVTSIDRSISGSPGGKNAKFYSQDIYGNIKMNNDKGIYGKYYNKNNNEKLKVATIDEITTGKAYIYTVLEGSNIEPFEIYITKIDKDNEVKNIYFDVTDKKLLDKTGGIVQGMSGSPIIQNNQIIGAVTHVVVSNPKSGYGVSIIKMLEEGDKIKND